MNILKYEYFDEICDDYNFKIHVKAEERSHELYERVLSFLEKKNNKKFSTYDLEHLSRLVQNYAVRENKVNNLIILLSRLLEKDIDLLKNDLNDLTTKINTIINTRDKE